MATKNTVKYWRDMQDGVDYIYTPALRGDAVVDIRMTAYNHEPYIRHAIESVLMQETRYPYRLVIGDDCSPDRTQEIIREYQAAHPDRIATILWNYNTGLTGRGSNGITISRYCTAPYVAMLEGDDYWTSPYKLERAVSFLEDHPEYIAYAHNINLVNEDESTRHQLSTSFGVREEHVYTRKNALNMELAAHVGALVYRNIKTSWPESTWDDYYRCRANGDEKLSVVLGMAGDIYCAREVMEDHRRVFRGTSWTARTNEKNLAPYFYSSTLQKAALIRKLYGLEAPVDKLVAGPLCSARESLLREFNRENLSAFLKVYSRELRRRRAAKRVRGGGAA